MPNADAPETTAAPETIDAYYARVVAAADAERRLTLDAANIPGWDIFPFEGDGLRLKAIEPLADVEEPRYGEDPATCWCASGPREGDGLVWSDDRWTLEAFSESGAPLVMMLTPRVHCDFAKVPAGLAGEMGRLMVAIGAAIESLPSVGRVHMSKWGDGGAHLHLFFFARPTRMPQMRGTCLALWDDFLPRVPAEVIAANAAAVAAHLAADFGGRAVSSARPAAG